MNAGDICEVCKRVYHREFHRDYVDEGCSEFCATVTAEEKAKFPTLKSGDYGVFPCSECGCATEGDYEPGEWCGKCHPKVQLRLRDALLQEAIPHLPAALVERIQALK